MFRIANDHELVTDIGRLESLNQIVKSFLRHESANCDDISALNKTMLAQDVGGTAGVRRCSQQVVCTVRNEMYLIRRLRKAPLQIRRERSRYSYYFISE